MYGTQTLNLITTFGSALGSSFNPLISLSNVLQEKKKLICTNLAWNSTLFGVKWGRKPVLLRRCRVNVPTVFTCIVVQMLKGLVSSKTFQSNSINLNAFLSWNTVYRFAGKDFCVWYDHLRPPHPTIHDEISKVLFNSEKFTYKSKCLWENHDFIFDTHVARKEKELLDWNRPQFSSWLRARFLSFSPATRAIFSDALTWRSWRFDRFPFIRVNHKLTNF